MCLSLNKKETPNREFLFCYDTLSLEEYKSCVATKVMYSKVIILHMHCKCNAYVKKILVYTISKTNVLRGINMGNFKIPSIPNTTNKTIRFPNDVIEKVENAIEGKDCTFSAFVIAAVRAAIEDISNSEEE